MSCFCENCPCSPSKRGPLPVHQVWVTLCIVAALWMTTKVQGKGELDLRASCSLYKVLTNLSGCKWLNNLNDWFKYHDYEKNPSPSKNVALFTHTWKFSYSSNCVRGLKFMYVLPREIFCFSFSCTLCSSACKWLLLWCSSIISPYW